MDIEFMEESGLGKKKDGRVGLYCDLVGLVGEVRYRYWLDEKLFLRNKLN